MIEYIADFETCKYDNKQRVWLWGIRKATDKIDEHTEIGTDIQTFINYIKGIRQKMPVIFFHNLKYDASYLLDHLLKNGYSYTANEPADLKEYELTTNSNFEGTIYEVAVNMSGKIMRFKDSLKLFNASEEALATSYNLPTKKGKIDYLKPRSPEYVPTIEEIEYIKNDLFIVSYILYHFRKQGFEKYTASSSAFNEFVKMAYPRSKTQFSYNAFHEHHHISIEEDRILRSAYLGGYCYLNPELKGKTTKEGIVVDVNSMYAYVMYTQNMPYGKPLYTNGKPFLNNKYNIYISKVQLSAKLKKGYFPTISNKKICLPEYGYNDYIDDTHGIIEIYLTNIDIDLIFKNYDINYFEIIESWSFKSKRGGLFKDYIERFYTMKKEAREKRNETQAQLAKIFLTGLYGKFGTNPMIMTTKPIIDNDVIRFSKIEHKEQDPIYLPLSIFITSYAREVLINAALNNKERFIYCDTDSLHLTGTETPNGIKIDAFELGAWKIETTFRKARYLNHKQYIEQETNGSLNIRCAGLSTKSKDEINFDNFVYGNEFKTITSIKTNGGIELTERIFKLK